MPRLARLDAPFALHHVMIRGIVVSELGIGITDQAKAFGMRPSALGYAVPRAKNTAYEKAYSLAK
jgi:hypothetical protein